MSQGIYNCRNAFAQGIHDTVISIICWVTFLKKFKDVINEKIEK